MKNLFLTICCIVLCFSCSEEFLELEPRGSDTEANFYKTQEHYYQGIISVYDVLSWGGTNGWTMAVGLANAASDDCYAGGSDASDQPSWVAYDNFTINPELGPQSGLWTKYYTGIARANLILEKILIAEDIDADFLDRITAEAKVLRAYYYFELVRLFGNVIKTEVRISPDAIYTQDQVGPSVIYDFIESDLNSALASTQLPDQVDITELGRVSKDMARMLLGKTILYRNDNSRMQEAADLFEDLVNSGRYSLESEFGNIFSQNNEWGVESIFEINYSGNQRGGWGNFSNGTEGNYNQQFFGMRDYVGPDFATGWSFCPVTESLAEFMQNDPRFEHTIIDGIALQQQGASYSPAFQNTDFFIRKYAGLQENVATDGEVALNWANNERVMRYADVLLMAAECLLRGGGDESQARNYVNQVRSRVGLQPISNAGESLLQAIYRERRMELATEGHRFFDLVRTGQAATVLDGFVEGKHDYLPIPQREIDLSNGSLNQNSGY